MLVSINPRMTLIHNKMLFDIFGFVNTKSKYVYIKQKNSSVLYY